MSTIDGFSLEVLRQQVSSCVRRRWAGSLLVKLHGYSVFMPRVLCNNFCRRICRVTALHNVIQ